jgi:hypothetical protein
VVGIPADHARLDDRDARAQIGSLDRGRKSGGSAAENKEVMFLGIAHGSRRESGR